VSQKVTRNEYRIRFWWRAACYALAVGGALALCACTQKEDSSQVSQKTARREAASLTPTQPRRSEGRPAHAGKEKQPTSASVSLPPQTQPGESTGTLSADARQVWAEPLPSVPLESLIPEPDESDLPPAEGKTVLLYVYDRVRRGPAAGIEFYARPPATHRGPFVTNKAGFTRIFIAPGHENDTSIELEFLGNFIPLLSDDIRLWQGNEKDRRVQLDLKKVGPHGALFLPIVPVVRAEVAVYEDVMKRMINVPVTLTPLNALAREPLTLTAGAEDEIEAARFAIPAREGDTYRVSVGENVNTGPMDIGIFTVRKYREPILLRVNLFAARPPLEIITAEH